MIFTIIVFLLVLSILVLIHEAGHFFVAKKLGVKVEEFGFGFPPRIFGKKIGETIYSINLLPIGGFVKLYGEDDTGGGKIGLPKNETTSQTKELHRAFFARPIWQRAAIVIAGVVMNFLLAIAIISYLFAVQGVSTLGNNVLVAQVAQDAPAKQAGMQAGDTIVSVNGIKPTTPDQVISATKKLLGQPVNIVVKHKNGQQVLLVIIPRKVYPRNEGPMGIAIAQSVIVKKYPWYQAPFVGTVETLKDSWMIVEGLGSIITQVVVSHSVPQGVAGPVGIAQLTGQVVKIGPSAVLSLIGLLSLNLAIMNILPIPALDGGRLFFILIEAVTRKKVNPKFEGYAHAIGMAVLLTLIILITFHDIVRVISGQPILPK